MDNTIKLNAMSRRKSFEENVTIHLYANSTTYN